MSKIHHDKCPVCGSNNFSPFIESNDFSTSHEDYNICKCTDCSFAFTQDIPNQENIGSYYKSENYVSHSNTKKGMMFKIYHLVRNYMLKSKQKTVENNTGIKNGKILDIGTGTGFFSNQMQKAGWDVSAIEQDKDAREFAKREFNLDVLPPSDFYNLNEKSFDVVSMWHVLEHVHDLDGYLKTIHKILSENGHFVAAVPNYKSYDAKHYKKYWAAYDLPIHLWHFSPSSIKLLVEKYGFKLVAKKGMPFDSFYVSMLSETYKGSSLGFVRGAFHGFISWIKSLSNTDNYSSVIYIFKKQ